MKAFKKLTALALLLAISQSCEDKDKLITFNLTVNQMFVFPVQNWFLFRDNIEENESYTLDSPTFTFLTEKEFETNKTSPGKVRNATKLVPSVILRFDSTSLETEKIRDFELGFRVSGSTVYPLIAATDIDPAQRVFSGEILCTDEQIRQIINETNYRFSLRLFLRDSLLEPIRFYPELRLRLKAMPD